MSFIQSFWSPLSNSLSTYDLIFFICKYFTFHLGPKRSGPTTSPYKGWGKDKGGKGGDKGGDGVKITRVYFYPKMKWVS